MRISIIGAGGIGSALAAYLARAGHSVTLVFKDKRDADSVRANGLHMTGGQSFLTKVDVIEWPALIPASDLAVLAVKTYDTRDALRCAVGIPIKMAISAQNGLQKEEILAEYLGRECVIGSVVEVTAMRRRDGTIFSPDVSLSHIGETNGADSPRVRYLARTLSQSGLAAKPAAAIRSVQWTKACQWTATSLLSVMSGYPYPFIFSTDWLAPLFVEIVRNCAAVARAEGAHIADEPSFFVDRLLDIPIPKACAWLHKKGTQIAATWGARYKASMLLDVESGARTEFDDLVGYIVLKAQQHDIETPALDFAIRQVRNYIGSTLSTTAERRMSPPRAAGRRTCSSSFHTVDSKDSKAGVP
jgi:2-dehydropantoate 2-reductase